MRNGIISEDETKKKASVHICSRCDLVNSIDNKYCSKCSYPLTPQAFEEIKNDEEIRIKSLEEKYQKDIKSLKEEMENKFNLILEKINISQLN